MERVYTVETRIRLNQDIREYLNSYVTYYNRLYRIMWHQMSSVDFKTRFTSPSYYLTYICNIYGVLRRTANTIYKDIIGRQKALLELKKLELSNIKQKLNKCNTKIEELKLKINKSKPLVAENKLNKYELKQYRLLKQRLYHKQNKFNRLKQKERVLCDIVNNKRYDLCFGSKRWYKAQWYLQANKLKTHEKWYNLYVKNRDKCINYLGSADESCGNQMCQLEYHTDTDIFSIKIRKENKYVTEDKYLYIDGLDFKYMRSEIIEICTNHKNKSNNRRPLTIRFKRKGNKWYVQLMFSIKRIPTTRYDNGVIGLDFNSGFIEATETDKQGNIVKQYHFGLNYHGCGNKAKNEMAEVVSRIVTIAVSKGKDISVEKLNFNKKKATVGKNKQYNKMLHTLDYSRYTEMIQNVCHRKQVGLVQVNPAYTSIIGNNKYGRTRKLNRHQSASYVIARLGQGYTDTYGNHSTIV